MHAVVKPRKYAPPSPMKMRAGDQLWHRNPINDPASTKKNPAISHRGSSGRESIITANIKLVIRPIPADSPSMLSRKLNELTSTTHHATVSKPPTHGSATNRLARTPDQTTAADTPTCSSSLGNQGSGRKSSNRPATAKRSEEHTSA